MTINPLQGASLTARSAQDTMLSKKNNDFQDILSKVQNEKDDKKLREACQEMEAVYVNQLLRQMRATVPKSGLMEESAGSAIYKEMLDEEYSKLIAKSPSSLGIAEMLYKQLKQDTSTVKVNE